MVRIYRYLIIAGTLRNKYDFRKVAKGLDKEEVYFGDDTKEVKVNFIRNVCNKAVNLGEYKVHHDKISDNSFLRLFVIGRNVYMYADCMGYIVKVMISDYDKRVKFIETVHSLSAINLSSITLLGYNLHKLAGDHGDNGNVSNPIRYGVYSFQYKTKELRRTKSGKLEQVKKIVRVQMHNLNYLLANPKDVEEHLFNDNLVINHKHVSKDRNYVEDVHLNSAWNLEMCTRSLNVQAGKITNKQIGNREMPVVSIKDIIMTFSEVCKRHKLDINKVRLRDGNIVDKHTDIIIFHERHLCKIVV